MLNNTQKPTDCDFNQLIEKHAAERPLVLVAGGDGSANAVLKSLLKHDLTLVLVPSGTANNLARTLEIPKQTEEALALIQSGSPRMIDVGVVNEIPFLNVVGLGLGTQVNRVVRSELKKWLGAWAFVLTALKVAVRMTPFRFQLEYDGQIHQGKSWQVSICNGRNYGNGLVIHEDASLYDETLHGLSTESKKWWHAFILIPSLITGKFQGQKDVSTFQAKEMKLTTKRPMHVDVDGDIKTKTPLLIGIHPKTLRILVPRSEKKT